MSRCQTGPCPQSRFSQIGIQIYSIQHGPSSIMKSKVLNAYIMPDLLVSIHLYSSSSVKTITKLGWNISVMMWAFSCQKMHWNPVLLLQLFKSEKPNFTFVLILPPLRNQFLHSALLSVWNGMLPKQILCGFPESQQKWWSMFWNTETGMTIEGPWKCRHLKHPENKSYIPVAMHGEGHL